MYWLVHFTHLVLWIFELSKTQLGGWGHFAKNKRRTQRATYGEGKENYSLLFSPSPYLVFCTCLPLCVKCTLRLAWLTKSACHEGYMRQNSKEKRPDWSKNNGEGVSNLRNRLQENKQLSFLCPRRGVLAEIVIFFSFPSSPQLKTQWQIQGRGPAPLSFLDQTNA